MRPMTEKVAQNLSVSAVIRNKMKYSKVNKMYVRVYKAGYAHKKEHVIN